MKIKVHFFLLIFVLLSLNGAIKAQQTPKLFFGSYIASSPYGALLPDSLYQQIHNCGLNAAQLYAKKTYPTNLSKLSEFEYVYAANDSAPEWAFDPGNIDWINYFTHAKYYRWEAEGDENFPADQGMVGVKHEFGHSISQGWSTGQYYGQEIEPNRFIHGPHYTQYKKYTYVNRDIGVLIPYKAVFRMKMTEPTGKGSSVDIAQIRVELTNESTGEIDTLASLILTSDSLSLEYKDFFLEYDYRFYPSAKGDSMKYPSPIGSDWIPFGDTKTTSWIDFNLKVDFVVEWLGGTQLDVDYIDVYDEPIWKHYYVDYPDSLDYYVSNYLDEYESANSTFYSKLKYFVALDEPHTWDSFIPVRKVQETLDGLQSGKSLLVHFYPGWNNEREGVYDVLEKWVSIAQPKKLMFWYAPFVCDTSHVPYSRSFTLYQLHYVMQRAHELQPDFFLTPQSFCKFNMNTNQYDDYMYPTTRELGAQTMLGLAHGVKGINYEQYFSYNSIAPYRNYGLVDMSENNYTPLPLWYKVQELASRIEGPLGQTLNGLDYSGDYLVLRKFVEGSTDDSVQIHYLSLDTNIGQILEPDKYNFHAGLFEANEYNKYFLLVNMLTDSLYSRVVNIGITDDSYTNIRVRNIEPEYDFDTTFTGSISFNYLFPEGEGYLFQVAPVVKYGGKLLFNETISSTFDLTDNLIIYQNATLTITGTYNIHDTLIINSGGYLVVSSGGKINVCEGGKIINNGNIMTENAEIKFSDGISLRNNGNLNASYTLFSALSNNWDGIYFSSGSSGTINYCTIEKSSGALITLNNSSPDIKNSSFHDCVNGIDVLNGSSAFIYRDTIYNFTVNGIYIDNSAPFLALNVITGDQNHDPSVPVKCENYATPYFSNLEECNGRNTLQNGTTGVTANNYSSVYMGTEAEYYHLNRIINNTYYASADSNSVIYAQLNWWGTSDPNKDLFLAGQESFIYFDPYLTEDPLEGFLMGGENNYSFLDQQLIEAKRLTIDSNYTGASNIYRSMIVNNPDSAQSGIALVELKEILRKTDNNTNLNFIAQLTDTTGNHPLRKRALESLSGIFLRKKNYPSAQAVNNYLIQNYGNTEYEKSGRRNKFYAHFAKNEFNQAKEELDIIKSKYETDDQIQAMDWLLYLEGYNPLLLNKPNKSIAAVKTVINKFSSQNYPNPFNPSTTIRFYIEQRGKVNLTIYDILGRRVSTLVDEIKDPGEYEVKFDGTRYASGVYIYRLQSNEQVLTRKFILMK